MFFSQFSKESPQASSAKVVKNPILEANGDMFWHTCRVSYIFENVLNELKSTQIFPKKKKSKTFVEFRAPEIWGKFRDFSSVFLPVSDIPAAALPMLASLR